MTDDFGFIVAEATAQNPRNTEGDIIELADGTLLLAWSDFYAGEMPDHAPARISAMISTDGGRPTAGPASAPSSLAGLRRLLHDGAALRAS